MNTARPQTDTERQRKFAYLDQQLHKFKKLYHHNFPGWRAAPDLKVKQPEPKVRMILLACKLHIVNHIESLSTGPTMLENVKRHTQFLLLWAKMKEKCLYLWIPSPTSIRKKLPTVTVDPTSLDRLFNIVCRIVREARVNICTIQFISTNSYASGINMKTVKLLHAFIHLCILWQQTP